MELQDQENIQSCKQLISLVSFQCDPEYLCFEILEKARPYKNKLELFIQQTWNQIVKHFLLYNCLNKNEFCTIIDHFQKAIQIIKPIFPNSSFLLQSIYYETHEGYELKKNKKIKTPDSVLFLFELTKTNFQIILYLIELKWIDKGFLIYHKLIRYMLEAYKNIFTSDGQLENINQWILWIQKDQNLSLSLTWIQWRIEFQI